MTKSTDGREWAHLSELKPGDRLILDGGFANIECALPNGACVTVVKKNGELGFYCAEGFHGLVGQLDTDSDSLVGCWPA